MTNEGREFLELSLSLAMTCLALGVWVRRKELAPRRWPQVPGKIVASRLERYRDTRGGQVVVPVVEYEFDFDGQAFRSSHWRTGNYSTGNSESARAVTERYAAGLPVTVFVDPRQPMKSVLESNTTPLSWVPIGFGIGFGVLALLPLFRP